MRQIRVYGVFTVFLALCFAGLAQTENKQFRKDCAILTSGPHRLTGSRELGKAVDYVKSRLESLKSGLKKDELQVYEQRFPTVQLIVKRCELVKANKATIQLLPMRPNGVIPPVTPENGITGTLFYAGKGELKDYKGRLPKAAIVVLDYNCQEAWLTAFRMGASAVIFTREATLTSPNFHYTHMSANMPRFFYNGKHTALPIGKEVTLHSEIVWDAAVGRNIIGFLKGAEPVIDAKRGEETFVFAANLDTFGEVPQLSKGARSAANCAALLNTAEHLAKNRPRRNVVIAFFDAQWNGHMGASAFYRLLDPKKSKEMREKIGESLTKEKEFLNKVLALASQEEPLADKSAKVRANFVLDLKRLAANHVFAYNDELLDLRWARRENNDKIKNIRVAQAGGEKGGTEEIAKIERKNSALEVEIDALTKKKEPWNNLRRALTKKEIVFMRAAVKEKDTPVNGKTPIQESRDQLVKQKTPEMTALEKEIAAAEVRLDAATKELMTASAKLKAAKEEDRDAAGDVVDKKQAELDRLKVALGDLKKKLEKITPTKFKRARKIVTTYEERVEVLKCYSMILGELKVEKDLRLKDLADEQAQFDVDQQIYSLLTEQWIGLHASLLLGDGSARWGLVVGGDSNFRSREDQSGLYNRVQSGFLDAYRGIEESGTVKNFEPKTADLSLTPSDVVWAAPKLAHSGDIAGRLGFYNLAFGTVHERLPYEGTPDDTFQNLKLDRVEQAAKEVAALAKAAGDNQKLSLDRMIKHSTGYQFPTFEKMKVKGTFVMAAKGSSIPNDPTPGAIIQLYFGQTPSRSFSKSKVYGMNGFQVLRSNKNGTYQYGPALPNNNWRYRLAGFGVVFNERGEVELASSNDTLTKVDKRVDVRKCRPGVLVLPPVQAVIPGTANETRIMDGASNGELEIKKAFAYTSDGLVVWYAMEKTRSIKAFNTETVSVLRSGPAKLEPKTEKVAGDKSSKKETEKEIRERTVGAGVNIEQYAMTSTTQQSGADMWRLNQFRLSILRDRGVKDSSISELHGRAEDLMLESDKAKTQEEAEAKAAASFHLQRKVYKQVREMFDDLVLAVLILLALCVPFAFAVERLLIGATSIYRQIMYFAGFFVLTFILLYNTHPAFAISNAPLIIFLGFAILILSSMVIWIIMRKFEVELKVLQGLESTVHAADISRVSTIAAAMNMGISSMRRRPLRTALSAITIILLTFTILCFASFGTQTGIIRLFSQPAPDYTAVFVRDYNWSELSADFQQVIRGRWNDKATLCPRYWICPGEVHGKTGGLLITRGDASNPLVLRGVLGLDYKELDKELRLRKEFRDLIKADKATFDSTVWITESTAKYLNVSPGDKVMLKGETLTVGNLIDEVRLSIVRDMDDSSVLPVDFEEDSSVSKDTNSDPSEMEQKSWKTISVDACAIVSANTAKRLNARLRAIMMYTENPQIAGEIAEEVARFFPTPVPATLNDGVYLHVLGATLSASGVKDLFFPILLGGLVIFGTMLGSVADREKEVYTFSALGLAPPHVAGLFFAEALVYSVVGGLSGYLLAQMLMKVLNFMASQGWVTVPEMNYSSTNAIITILLVMATVLVSALYPAHKASKSANPGVMRNWKIPQPNGNILDLVFPFTVSQYDITGVVSFLREHFDTYSDTGLGTFMAQNTKLVKDEDGQLQLHCQLALAPFDLGVTQEFEMKSVPSEIEGIDEVAIRLIRLSGQPKDWYRLNKVLLDDLRKQFLIWRSLPPETMELYRERTLTELGDKALKVENSEGTNA